MTKPNNHSLDFVLRSAKFSPDTMNIVRQVLIAFIFVPFFFPTGLQYSSSFHYLFSALYYWRIAAAFVSLFLFAMYIFKSSVTTGAILFGVFGIWIFACTFLKNGSISSFFSSWGGFFCFYCGTIYFFKTFKRDFLLSLRNWLIFCAVINLITMIAYPNGLPLDNLIIINSDSKYVWFWSFKNSICNLIIPLLATAIYVSFLNVKYSKITLVVCVAISIVTSLLSHSSSLFFTIILLFVSLLLSRFRFFVKHFDIRIFGILGVVASIAIVFFKAQYLFPNIVEGLLGRDLSFTSRTLLWDYSIQDILASPIFGYGVQTSSTFGLLRYSNSYSHCHNAILTLAYQSGILGGLLFFVFFLWSIFSSSKWRTDSTSKSLNYQIGCVLFAQLFIHITGSIGGCGYFLILIMCAEPFLLNDQKANLRLQ